MIRLILLSLVMIGLATAMASPAYAKKDPDFFGVYIATLDGRNVQKVLASPTQQMTHVRPSPDGQWVTLTRYNQRGFFSGVAEEEGGYFNTEIMVARADGSDLHSVIPPKKGVIAANSNWSDDGKSLIYISTDTPDHRPQINRVDIQTRQITRLPIPATLNPTDPDWHGPQLVFPSKSDTADALWLMNMDGTTLRQLTFPQGFDEDERGGFNFGDYDPKFSPDGTKVAFMRYFGKETWRIYVIDVASGEETLLSHGNGADAIPEWSGDGEKLIFWHVDRADLPATGIYTMRPDGTDRTMIPLPRGVLHGHPVFWPGSGSDAHARFIYVAKKMPALK